MFLLNRFLKDCEHTEIAANNNDNVNDLQNMNDNEEPSTSAGASFHRAAHVKRVQGIVTLIDQEFNYGVIDNKYIFDLKKDVGHEHWANLSRGMKVSFVLNKINVEGRLEVAADIMPVSEQMESQAGKNSVVLKVMKVEDEFVLMGNDEKDTEPMKVEKQYLPTRFAVQEGDWLTLRMQHEDGGVDGASRPVPADVSWVDAVRRVGTIASKNCILSKDTNEKIYYNQDAVKYQREVTTGQEVSFMAIKSDREEEASFGGAGDNVTICKKYSFTKRALAVWTEADNLALAKSNSVDDYCESVQDEGGDHNGAAEERHRMLFRNKNRISIKPLEEVYFGSVVTGSKISKTITIENHGSDQIILQAVDILNSQSVCKFYFPTEATNAVIFPRVPLEITVHCDVKELGKTKETCIFDFGPYGRIGRYLCVNSTSPDEEWLIKADGGGCGVPWYVRKQNLASLTLQYYSDKKRSVIPAPTVFRAPLFSSCDIPKYEVPDSLRAIYLSHQSKLRIDFATDFKVVTPQNYETRFQESLWLEELARESRRVEYDMADVVLYPSRDGKFLVLEVPLLDEMVPPVLVGDKIECIHTSLSEAAFTATIEKISHGRRGDPKVYLKENFVRDAVQEILAARGRPLPYIIYGPPGTGKTVTIVEAILQAYFCETTSRILVTVPSNAGADLITERLVTTGLFKPKTEQSATLVRMNGFLRSESDIPRSILDFCEKGTDLLDVASSRLIISTVATAGQFFQLAANTAHFSHVFIDEAGFCMEPEALIPCVLAGVDDEAVIVLAGDHHQLGPVLVNNMETNIILKKSLLERLMESVVYQRNEAAFPVRKYNPALITKLVRSYRSHPALLKVPSELFYDGDLISSASSEAYDFDKTHFSFMAKCGVPLTFHGVQGNCRRDRNSPSWYNLEETAQVVKYVKKMKDCGISSEDIGIITPYRKQADKIHLALGKYFDDDKLKISSVQEFQGGEKKVIIISTVRSDYDEEAIAQKVPSYEFLYCPKLFNTAITRAKAFMVIVGNPYVLQQSPHWNYLLEYCVNLGVYVGCDLRSQLSQRLAMIERRPDSRADSASMDSFIDDEMWEEDGYAVKDNMKWALN